MWTLSEIIYTADIIYYYNYLYFRNIKQIETY